MTAIGQKERATQNRVIALFRKELGYRYLGNWADRETNSNIETGLLTAWLTKRGYNPNLIGKALYEFGKTAGDQSKSLYDVNKAVYALLRYGVNVQPEIGQNKATVWLIDWQRPLENDFALAEEVTIKGLHKKRPDLALYINGPAATHALPPTIQADQAAMAEVIENNLRRVIIEENPTNPMYYAKMSVLPDELIAMRKAATLDYEQYLQEIIALSDKIKQPHATAAYPASLNTPAKRALYDNLGQNEALANALDQKILTTKKDGWRDNTIKTREVRYAIQDVLAAYQVKEPDTAYIPDVVKHQWEY